MTARRPMIPDLRVRTAEPDDAALLLEWRNDAEVRSLSRSSAPIEFDEHFQWLQRTIDRPDRHLLVLQTVDGTPVATTRYGLLDGPLVDESSTGARHRTRWEISISVAPGMRGRGLGSATLQASDAWLRTAEPEATHVVAHVRPINAGSRRLFEGNGYRPAPSDEPDMLCYVRSLRGS